VREVTGPKLGLVHLLRMRRHPITHAAWLREQYGRVYRLRIFGVDMYVTSGPELFERVFVNRDKAFASGPAWSHFIGPFFHRGLMLLDFDEHLYHRRIMQHAFGTDELRRYHDLLQPHLRRHLDGWPTGSPEPAHLQRLFKDLTLDLALEVFVGVELDAAERERINRAFVESVRAGTALVRRDLPGGVGPWSRGLAARRVLETFFRDALPAKRRDGGDDLFARLCAAEDDEGNVFSDDDVVDHMIFLLMAAHDTTTTTMTQMAYRLAVSPVWDARCRAEVDRVTATAGPDPGYDDLLALTDLDLVMRESLRMCAPVPSIPRVATRDVELDGYRIPQGGFVTSTPYGNHYLDEVWPDPQRFDPERFSPERREDKVHRLAFAPFGAGVHKCIGMHFAGMQVRAVFHELLTRFRWSVPEGYELPVDLTALPYARDGLPVRLEHR
jgi:cytochrome P450